ncbi:hypothetical protein PQX77_005020 [Marasmius sp. AFHP31]|nr:hypothetical protein PQX77_005020 [Marasmius sp. AFHP31]
MFPSSPRHDFRPRQDEQPSSSDSGSSSTSSSQTAVTLPIGNASSDSATQGTTFTESSSSTSSSTPSSSSSTTSASSESSSSPTSSTSTSSSQSTEESSSVSSSSSSETVSSTSSSLSSSSISTTPKIESPTSAPTETPQSEHILVTVPSNSFAASSSEAPVTTPFSTTGTSPSPATSSDVSPIGATSESNSDFWSNKKAVAGTFTALALLLFGIGIAIVILLVRKRRRDRARAYDRDTLFSDKFPPEPGLVSRPESTSASDSEDLHRRQPMDGNTAPGYYNYQSQNSDPFADTHQGPHSNGSLTELTYSYARDVYNQYPAYDYEGSSNDLMPNGSNQQLPPPPQSYFDPLNPSSTNNSSNSLTNPFRDPSPGMTTTGRPHLAKWSQTPDRGSTSYQPSVDSFYGVEPTREGVGYAH